MFCYQNKLLFPISTSHQKIKNSIDLLLLIKENKSHYEYIKDFDRFMFHKIKKQKQKYFCKSCLRCFSGKIVLKEHKEDCLSIKAAQSVRIEKRAIEFKNYFKEISVPFKFYADFESNLKSVEKYKGFYSKKYQDHIPSSFAYKFVCVDDKFRKSFVVFRGENASFKFIESILKQYEYCKKVMKKKSNFNQVTLVGYVKNSLTMTMKKLEIIVT